MKKLLSVLLATLMLLTALSTAVFAASGTGINIPTPKITAAADRTSVEIGDIVTITVSIPEDTNLVDLDYTINFDTAYFQLIQGSAELYNAFSTEMLNDQISGEFKYIGTSGSAITDGATLFTVQFAILQTGGRLLFEIDEARVLSEGKVVNVTASSILASTKAISFKAASVASKNYFDIATPLTTTVSYKESTTLFIEQKRVPPLGAYYYRWSANNDNFTLNQSELGLSCQLTSVKNGDTTITVELVNALGEVVDSESIVMTSKAGLFDIISWFFEYIFLSLFQS